MNNENSTDAEVIVIGGGPSGAISSRTLAMLGHSVILVDQKKREKIGDKACGNAVDLEALEFIQEKVSCSLPSSSEFSEEVKSMRLETSSSFGLTLPAPGFILDRHTWGQRLIDEAVSQGVTLLSFSRVLSIVQMESSDLFQVTLQDRSSGEKRTLSSKILIDCSGARSIVRRSLPSSFLDRFHWLSSTPSTYLANCYRKIIRLSDAHPFANQIALRYDSSIPPPGYIWFFSEGSNRLNVGTGFVVDNTGSEKALNVKSELERVMNSHLGEDYEVEDARGGVVPMRFPLGSLVNDGVLLCGDAGCTTNPATAEGIGPALISGYKAGQVASSALKKGKVTAEHLWEYNRFVADKLGRTHAKSQLQINSLRKIGVPSLEFLFKRGVLTPKDLGTKQTADDLSLGKIVAILWRSFPRWKLVFQLRAMKKQMEKIDELYDAYPEKAIPEEVKLWEEKVWALVEGF
ncbi:MAG: FAD-dependent monooxygenase [Candidatus Heimdallarchaeota archaeon]|nr:FAD-dependent monooxygenase [Candidatus Heimdallarchaeota archaeon]MCK5048012.1 FAD-dependent monooxygenase [Candidatus Heimdallarchaeota archaeon]